MNGFAVREVRVAFLEVRGEVQAVQADIVLGGICRLGMEIIQSFEERRPRP